MERIHTQFKTVVTFGNVLEFRAGRLNSQSNSALSSWVALGKSLPLWDPQSLGSARQSVDRASFSIPSSSEILGIYEVSSLASPLWPQMNIK